MTTDRVAEYIAALRDEDWGIREEAAAALGECRDARGVRPLIEALHDEDRAVTAAAARALEAIGEPAVVAVGNCLRDPDASVQEAAASVLSVIADARVREPLTAALLSADWVVRMHAARAVGRLGDPRTVETLALLLQDAVPAVRDEAAAALTAIGRGAEPSALEMFHRTLVETLVHRDWRRRLCAVEALCVLPSCTAMPALLHLLRQDPDTAVRQEAARALGVLGDAGAADALLDAVKTPCLQVRAIEALGVLGSRRALPALFRLIGGVTPGEYENRTPACEENQLGPALAAAEEAVRALARIRDETAIPVLMRALDTTLLRQEARDALVGFGRPAAAALRERLRGEHDDNICCHIREALAQLGRAPVAGGAGRERALSAGSD